MVNRILWGLLFLYLVAFPFGQFTALPLPFISPEVRIYVTDLLVGVIGIVGTFGWKVNKSYPFRKSFVLFILVALFSLILATPSLTITQTVISFLYLVRLVSYGLFFFTVYNLISSKKESELVLNSLLVAGCAVSIFGIIQYILFPDLRVMLLLGWDEHLNRIVGTFFDPNFTSIILVFTLILFLGRNSFGKLSRLGMLGITFIALLLTYSRGGYLAFLVGIVVLSVIFKNLRIVLIPISLLIIGIYFLPKETSEGTKLERTTSAILRIENWKESLALASKNPVFGVGFNTLRYVRGPVLEKYGPSHGASGVDNSFLFVLVTTGVVGVIAFAQFLKDILNTLWKDKNARLIVMPTLAALFVHSMFVNSMFYPWVLGWISLLLASSLRRSVIS